jgi:Ni/Fe-hydrogenase subunit HybB-like protein
MWNPHSVMFEVAWCVTLYTLVLAAEASTLVFEKMRWKRATRIGHRAAFPLTLAAVLLSMLHQSSLGSLFLIVPGRLHHFWYTPLLPLLFFISAVAVGLVMTIIESNLSARALGRELEAGLLREVARIAAVVMTLYLIIRFSDMARDGVLLDLWPIDRAGVLLLLELGLGFIIPIALFASERIVCNARWLYGAAQLALLGFIINRLNVAIGGFEVVSGKTYTPAWTELAVTLMIVTVGVTAFRLAARYLPVFERDPLAQPRQRSWAEERKRQAALGILPGPVPSLAGSAGA